MAERGTMPSAGSAQAFAGVTPAWLRPAALALAGCVHLVVLVGIPWPTRTGVEFQRPLELQVIPQGQPADALRPLDTQQLAEVRPADATPSERPVETTPAARAQEVAAAAPGEAQASNPAERLADAEPPKQEALVAPEPAVTEAKPSDATQAVAADVTPPTSELQTATVINPPSGNSLPPQRFAAPDLKPTDAGAALIPETVASPMAELPTAEPSPAAAAAPSQNSPVPVTTDAKPSEVAQATAPVATAAPARELPIAEPVPAPDAATSARQDPRAPPAPPPT
jgi:hypothetical protein